MTTTTEAADRHRSVARTFADRVAGTLDWEVPTPVEGWVARDVVRHLVDWFPAFLAAGGIELATGPSVDADPLGAWVHQTDQVQALLDSGDAGRDMTHPRAGTHRLDQAIDRFYTADVFMHTWDLARATGQDDRLDADTCAAMLSGMQPIEDLLRGSGHYGPRVPVPPDASARDQLLAFIGRDPSWRP